MAVMFILVIMIDLADFGIDMYQGNLTTVNIKIFNISYILNPKTNLKINLGVTLRDFKNDDGEAANSIY